MVALRLTTQKASDLIQELTGFDGIPFLQYLKSKRSATEEQIAKGLRMEINMIRHRLYLLQKHNLVRCDREKDTKNNIYIYHWSFNAEQLPKLRDSIENLRKERLSHLLIHEQTSSFYLCEADRFRIEFEKASEYHFKCPECGKIMELENNKERIALLKKELDQYGKNAM